MEDSDISSNATDTLSKMRRERINWINGNRAISINSETLDSATDSMKAELNKALSDTTARMENSASNSGSTKRTYQQDLRRINEDMVE